MARAEGARRTYCRIKPARSNVPKTFLWKNDANAAVRKEIERRIANVHRILQTKERLEGYVEIKLKRVLPHLERALAKIEEGTYGHCDACGDDIPKARLEKVPGATRCAACQSLYERQP